MSDNFIHDPEGILIFDEPTKVKIKSGSLESEATIEVLPYSAIHSGWHWAGYDSYLVPEDASYTTIEDLSELL